MQSLFIGSMSVMKENTNNVNEYLIDVNKSADYTVFVSNWLMNLFENQGISHQDKKVILAGADKNVFNSENFNPWCVEIN